MRGRNEKMRGWPKNSQGGATDLHGRPQNFQRPLKNWTGKPDKPHGRQKNGMEPFQNRSDDRMISTEAWKCCMDERKIHAERMQTLHGQRMNGPEGWNMDAEGVSDLEGLREVVAGEKRRRKTLFLKCHSNIFLDFILINIFIKQFRGPGPYDHHRGGSEKPESRDHFKN